VVLAGDRPDGAIQARQKFARKDDTFAGETRLLCSTYAVSFGREL